MNDSDQTQYDRLKQLLVLLCDSTVTEEQFRELDSILKDDAKARQIYRDYLSVHNRLLSDPDLLLSKPTPSVDAPAVTQPAASAEHVTPLRTWRLAAVMVASVAAGIMLAWISGLTAVPPANPSVNAVAEIVSASEAAWESSLPTKVGSRLVPGSLQLKQGVAEIRFDSGALVALEAPAHLVVQTAMKARLLAGTAVVEAPESAKGFTVDTPDGHAIDHGTQFAVSVDGASGVSQFEVLKGEISVHHPETNGVSHLFDEQAASVTTDGIRSLDDPMTPPQRPADSADVVRIGTGGRETSIIKSNKRRFLDADMLMVKRTREKRWHRNDRRALFSFSLSDVRKRQIQGVTLRLNQVPSREGFASELPEVCEFKLFGITDEDLEHWSISGLKWEDAPGSVDSGSRVDGRETTLLAQFSIPRGRQSGTVLVESSELTEFIQQDTTDVVSFLLVRKTRGKSARGLVHAFASSRSTTSAGPTLEIVHE